MTPVFKNGDSLCMDNCRPIAVTKPDMRLYTRILNARLVEFTDNNTLLAHTQSPFRSELSTLRSTFALQHLVYGAQANGQQLYTCFQDLQGACDRVHAPCYGRCYSALGCTHQYSQLCSPYMSGLNINIKDRSGMTVQSHTGV